MTFQRLVPWALRAAWAVLPFTVGPAVAGALAEHGDAVGTVATVGLWAVWGGVLVATLFPHPVSLTAVRCATPGAVVATAAAGIAGHWSPPALATAALATAVAFLPETGAVCVNGPAYPNERRFLLRAPAPLLLGVLGLAWALAFGPLVAGLLLLAAAVWVAGGVLLALGLPLSWLLLRGMHSLSLRWFVFVPAGVVLHDPIAMADPVLMRRQTVAGLGPAESTTTALDLTQTAPGLAVELALTEPVPMMRVRPGRRQGESVSAARLLFTPTRPGALLEEAAARGLPVR
ncbi:MAG TPA: hypothetical protein VFJ85_08715 [Acidimicrobiales bacterium]|nr:hypothetical protein [Acidimicrobiales bacterium]